MILLRALAEAAVVLLIGIFKLEYERKKNASIVDSTSDSNTLANRLLRRVRRVQNDSGEAGRPDATSGGDPER